MNLLTTFCRLALPTMAALATGCGTPDTPSPAKERFYFIAEGIDGEVRLDAYRAVTQMIGQITVPGEHITVVATPKHELIATICVPEGSKSVRLRKPAIRREVHALAEFFESDSRGPASQADSTQAAPAKIATTVRSLRRTELPVQVVVVADPVYVDPDHPSWSMTDGKAPRGGSTEADFSPWRVTQKLPAGTSVAWMTPAASFGDNVFHQEAITQWYRHYTTALGGSLDCMTPNASLAFSSRGTQFTDPLGQIDDGVGMRSVVGVDETIDPVAVAKPEPESDAEASEKPAPIAEPTASAPPIDWCDTPPASHKALRGNLSRVVFIRDLSQSMVEDSDGNDRSHLNVEVVVNMAEMIGELECDYFAVIGFGGQGKEGAEVRLVRHPWSFWSPGWSQATGPNRQKACEAMARWQVGGGTSTLAALKDVRRLTGATNIVLWSDGLPSIGEGPDTQQEVLDTVRELAAEGITVNTIGVGELSGRGAGEVDSDGCQFLKQIADASGGAYLAL